MKKRSTILVFFLASAVLSYGAIFLFVNIKGKDILKEKIKLSLGKEPSVESLSFAFPFKIRIKNFKCGDLAFRRADISPGFPKLFVSFLNLRSVYLEGFNFKLKKNGDKFTLAPFLVSDKLQFKRKIINGKTTGLIPLAFAGVQAKAGAPSFALGNLYLKDASGEFIDLSGREPVKFIFKDIQLRIKNLVYPRLTKFYLKLKASLAAEEITAKDALSFDGWIDFFTKNMEATFTANSIDYRMLRGYYPSFWKPENLKIKKALLSLRSELVSLSNALVIDNFLSVDRIEYEGLGEDEASSRTKTIRTALAIIKGSKDKPVLHFRMKTKMDSPRLDFASLRSTLSEIAPVEPARIFGEIIERVKDKISKKEEEAPVDGAADKIKETLDTLKGIFGN